VPARECREYGREDVYKVVDRIDLKEAELQSTRIKVRYGAGNDHEPEQYS
jgi:hypothetical protein